MAGIETASYGTADFVSEITFVKEGTWGGFRVLMGAPGPRGAIFLAAERWTGVQPRMVLVPGDPGYEDWVQVVAGVPERPTTHRFVGSAQAARNGRDQWLTHGPSPLLGK